MSWTLEESRPIWVQLCEQIEDRVLTGTYPPGSRLPSVRDLAGEAGVNPNTMQRALAALEDRGLLVTNRTAGRTVTLEQERVDTLRRQHAGDTTKQYLLRMERLGYNKEETIGFIQERE